MGSPLAVHPLREAGLTGQRMGPVVFQIKVLASPAAVAAAVVTEQSITVTGLAAGDIVLSVNKPTINGAIGVLTGRVSAANTWQATFVNPTAAAATPTASQVYDLIILRPAT